MPMPSHTFAARVSACSRTSSSTSMIPRIASGSDPSTTSCRPFCTKVSFSFWIMGSRPNNPCLRAMFDHSMILRISSSAPSCGGLNTQPTRLMACLNTPSGVCTKIDANVPTTTIMNAADDSSECRPAPLRIAPTRIATTASRKPTTERISMASSELVAPAGESRLQARQRLAMDLADARFTHLEHGSDLLQVHLVVVVQGHDGALAFRQVRDRIRECGAEALVDHVAERVRARIGGVDLTLFS